MIKYSNLKNNDNIKVLDEKGPFSVLEWQKDLSVNPFSAIESYFMQEMNFRKRQVLCNLQGTSVKTQAGAMQWTAGSVSMSSDIKGVGNFLGKMVKSAVTNESVAKPLYTGNGSLMLEPTYNYLLLENVGDWGEGIVLDDGLFLACEGNIKEAIVARKNLSSAVLGGEGLFNLSLSGSGYAVLESPVPREELIAFELDNDVLKVDGNMAIAWSKSLQFTVEKSSKSLIGSAVSGEGLVNVFTGTGRVLLAPNMPGSMANPANGPEQKSSSKGILNSVVNALPD